jgi:hypothetical protein
MVTIHGVEVEDKVNDHFTQNLISGWEHHEEDFKQLCHSLKNMHEQKTHIGHYTFQKKGENEYELRKSTGF